MAEGAVRPGEIEDYNIREELVLPQRLLPQADADEAAGGRRDWVVALDFAAVAWTKR